MFDTYAAQRINPQPYGTYRDTDKAKAERRQKWGMPNISPLKPKKASVLARRRVKQAQQLKNRMARAEHYSSNQGQTAKPDWHLVLDSLSAGTYG